MGVVNPNKTRRSRGAAWEGSGPEKPANFDVLKKM